jgi:hypothetical protein
MYNKKERQQYNNRRDIICEKLNITKNQYNWLRRKGEELRKVYENNCNGLYTSEIEYNCTASRIEGAIEDYIGGLHCYFQSDPRGASLYLDTKEIPDNNYTSANCIY